MTELDLNADVGEGDEETDAALIPLVSSANVACGLHAGDPSTMRATVALALAHGVAVGAHPGFDDREGFGRRAMHLPPAALADLILYQLGALQAIAAAHGAVVVHVKPHGALYNQAASDPVIATTLVAAVGRFDPAIRLVGRAASAMQAAAAAVGHPFTAEAFADRRYQPDGSLVSRSDEQAVLSDPEQVAAQVRRLVTDGQVVTIDGGRVAVAFQTLCLHGDTPGAPALATVVRRELQSLGVTVCAPRSLRADTLPP